MFLFLPIGDVAPRRRRPYVNHGPLTLGQAMRGGVGYHPWGEPW